MMRRAAKVDDNQKSIVTALRRVGFSVLSLATIGKGCPDIVVGSNGKNFLFEIKDGSKPECKRKLTPDEIAWHEAWKGQVHTVLCAEEIIAIVLKG